MPECRCRIPTRICVSTRTNTFGRAYYACAHKRLYAVGDPWVALRIHALADVWSQRDQRFSHLDRPLMSEIAHYVCWRSVSADLFLGMVSTILETVTTDRFRAQLAFENRATAEIDALRDIHRGRRKQMLRRLTAARVSAEKTAQQFNADRERDR